ncbi:hypothetical protein ADL02_06805 [Streptomyces sp. NRRL WC-3723]|nr:hypothetical protein ADL02_06805 [Streptomyces sp. NRRL WC-3723]
MRGSLTGTASHAPAFLRQVRQRSPSATGLGAQRGDAAHLQDEVRSGGTANGDRQPRESRRVCGSVACSWEPADTSAQGAALICCARLADDANAVVLEL